MIIPTARRRAGESGAETVDGRKAPIPDRRALAPERGGSSHLRRSLRPLAANCVAALQIFVEHLLAAARERSSELGREGCKVLAQSLL
jgi:hypothetical protein